MLARRDRILGCLLGTALGDAAGLPYEGLSAARVARRLGDAPLEPPRRALVSDDTEQTALIAAALAHARAPAEFERRVVRGLRRWFLALPPAIGFGTLRACLRLCLGARTGVASAGNAPAMRAAVIGVVAGDLVHLEHLVEAATRPTHTDPRALDAARIVAIAARAPLGLPDLAAMCRTPALATAITRAHGLAGAPPADVIRALGSRGGIGAFCVETVPAALWAVAAAPDPRGAIEAAVRLGGDTDTTAAIAGAIAGARQPRALPEAWLVRLGGWRDHLEDLTIAITEGAPPPRRYHPLLLVPRNLAVGIALLGQALRRAATRA